MAFCSFDESAALFDATPVENMFISEYMLKAPGDFVKVYLYGLMLCYHASERMSLASMARDLDVTQEEIERAYRYWEREGLVRRVGDNPVRYTYYNLKQITLTRAEKPGEQLYNRSFMEDVRRILNRNELRKTEMDMIYDWIDIYELPEEVVILLLKLEMEKSGGRVSIAIADKVAKEWAQSGICTVEDVEKIVVLGKEREVNLRKLLRRMGQTRYPSYDEKEMYNKWINDWGFTYDQIQDACKATTSGTPTMAYLDGILRRIYQTGSSETLSVQNEKLRFARKIFAALGRTGVTPSEEDQQRIDEWMLNGFSQDMIMMAAKEAHESALGGNLDSIESKLNIWRKNNFTSIEDILVARTQIKVLRDQIRIVNNELGKPEARIGTVSVDYFRKWTTEMGMSMDLILLAAKYTRESGTTSFKVLNTILKNWKQVGINTLSAAQAEHESHVRGAGAAKATAQTVRVQDTMQRHQYTADDYRSMITDLDEEE